MNPFAFNTVSSMVCERGCSQRIGNHAAHLQARSILLVTDAGLRKLGLLDDALASLNAAGLRVSIFDGIEADPPEQNVFDGVALAQANEVDLVIGFGGGSSMDVAKLIALLAHPECSQTLAQTYGVNMAKGPRLPLILVPTTAGTGSEVTPVAIITTGGSTKMGCSSVLLLPDLVLLDAQLTLGLPPHITAATGVDAMVHAIEAYTSKIKKNPYSDMLALNALSLLYTNIRTAVSDGSDLSAREAMLFGAMLAGQAFANAPVAAVHALAYPIGGRFHVSHGLSNSLVLPPVMRFNATAASSLYAELADHLMKGLATGSAATRCDQFIQEMEMLISDVGLPMQLGDVGITEADLDMLAADAMLQTRLLVNNPREVSEADARSIYAAVL